LLTGKIPLASQVWNFAPLAQNYARSRGATPFFLKSISFLERKKPSGAPDGFCL
jgi:hypothetical protein